MSPDRPRRIPRAALVLGLMLLASPRPSPAIAGSDGGRSRRLGVGFGASLGAFHSCPTFILSAAFPAGKRLSVEAEFSYAFNPDEDEPLPPPGYHRSSAGLGLTLAGIAALGSPRAGVRPYAGAGAGWMYLSTLTDRPAAGREVLSRHRLAASLFGGLLLRLSAVAGLKVEPRLLLLSGSEGAVLRLSAGAFVVF
jgi:hypothetical protein